MGRLRQRPFLAPASRVCGEAGGGEMLSPAFRSPLGMQFVGMMTAIVFPAAGFSVSLVVTPAAGHKISLMKLMQQYIAPLWLYDSIINPDLIFRHEFVNIVMATFGKVDIKYTAHEAPINNPND